MAAKKPLVLDSSGDLQQIQAGDFVDVTQGGTGAVTAAGARTALGLAIGSATQAWGASLDAIQALNTTGHVVRTGANTFATRSISAPAAGIAVTNPDGVAGNTTLSLSNDLAALEGLASTGIAVRTAADTWAQRTLAVQPRLTVSNADGVAGNPTFDFATVADSGIGSLLKVTRDTYGRVTGTAAVTAADLSALLNTVYLGLNGGTLAGPVIAAADPTQPLGLATKQYVDAFAQGQVDKGSVRALVTTNINVANPGTSTFDTYVASNGDRIFLAGQTAAAENGPWVFNGSAAAFTRPIDWDASTDIVAGATFYVTDGTANKNSNWSLITPAPWVLGTTAMSFTQTNGLGDIINGNGLSKNGSTLSVNASARFQFPGGVLDLANSGIAAGQYTKITFDVYGRATSGTNATPADIGAQPVNAELTGVSALAANGIVARTAAGTYVPRTLTVPAAGLGITNGDGVAGNPTFALANDLAALEGLGATGFAARIANDTWSQRILTGTAGRINVTNGDGIAGNPTFDLPSGIIAPGTYQSLTVDTYGRAIAGSQLVQNGSLLTNNEVATIVAGSAVYSDGSGTVKKAVANAAGTSLVVGLANVDVAAAAAGAIKTADEITLTTAQWDAVTGQTGGLTTGVKYFLDNTTAGHITTTAPSSGYIVPVGQALSATRMLVRVGQRVQL